MAALLERNPNLRCLVGNNYKFDIVCADDIYYNIEALRLVFQDLGVLQHCHFFKNGQEVIEYCKDNVNGTVKPYSKRLQKDLPIVIVDFEMPECNGLDTIKEIKALYTITNHMLAAKKRGKQGCTTNADYHLVMPKFVMFSAHVRRGFESFIKEKGVDFIISKPPNKEEIFNILVSASFDAQRESERDK